MEVKKWVYLQPDRYLLKPTIFHWTMIMEDNKQHLQEMFNHAYPAEVSTVVGCCNM